MKPRSEYVSTKIGTIGDIETASIHGGGKTHPCAVYPSGMVQFGPDTFAGGDNGSGYSYHHTTIDGFSINRMSGVGWYGDLGNLQLMPITGPLSLCSGTYRDAKTATPEGVRGYESDFSHDTEITEAGYYAVTLDTYGIRAETTASAHTGMLRVSYPASGNRRMQINLARRIAGRSPAQELTVVDDRTLRGVIHCPSSHGGFGRGEGGVNYDLYFYMEFSSPWEHAGLWDCGAPKHDALSAGDYQGEELWFYADFPTLPETDTLCVRVGISYMNAQGAYDNFMAEAAGVSFDELHARCKAAWEDALSVVSCEGAAEETLTVFYSAMYHTLLDPRIISDSNGNYRTSDGCLHCDPSSRRRTVFSGWDVFRSEFPLLTLISPDTVNDMILSLIDIAEHGSFSFPRWELLGTETGCMLGDPGVIVTTDAYRKGIRDYDTDLAYDICLRSANDPRTKRTGAMDMLRLGYVPDDISRTLENAFADHCTALLARERGDTAQADEFFRRGQNYRNLFDAETGYMRRRDEAGNFAPWCGEYDEAGCTESNIFQQSWFVPHDIRGLISLMGQKRFLSELERLMAESDLGAMWNTAYNHPNEPCHHIAHIFTDAGCPDRTQYWVRRIQRESYNTTAYGYCGNEDVGQMSAWYVLTAIGIHMVAPGSNVFHVNTPLFARTVIRLSRRFHRCSVADTLTFVCDRDPATNPYIRGITVNGTPIDRAWLTWDEISSGGEIVFHLSDTPDNAFVRRLPPAYL